MVDPEEYEPIPWPDELDTRHVLQDLDDKRLTYEQVQERAVEELLRGNTNDGLLLGFVMREMEKWECAWPDAYFWSPV